MTSIQGLDQVHFGGGGTPPRAPNQPCITVQTAIHSSLIHAEAPFTNRPSRDKPPNALYSIPSCSPPPTALPRFQPPSPPSLPHPLIPTPSTPLRKILPLLLDRILHPQQNRRLPLIQLTQLIELKQLIRKRLLIALLDRFRQIGQQLVFARGREGRIQVAVGFERALRRDGVLL